jgi:uncharacterized membrane protein YphA (DoxX/SURF4 family)
MKILANISRLFVGIVFIFSGFVKGVDPLGFTYRLEDYFIAFNIESLMPLALVLTILLCTVEFTIGIMLLLNLKIKLASWLLLLMMLFFTLLTFNDAINNPVPDCGCFGDAIKLTNWQTFYKNVVLMVPTMIIFIYRNKFKGFSSHTGQWAFTFIFALIFSLFCTYCYRHLPVIDFTEWKSGVRLYAENPQPVNYYLIYKNKETGQEKEYLSPNYPYDDSVWMANWVFVSQRVDDPNQYAGKTLIILDSLQNNITESIIRNPGYQVIVNAYDLEKANIKAFKQINELGEKLRNDGVSFAVLVSADPLVVGNFVKQHTISLDFYQSDDIILKTMVRANPGMMLLKSGMIIDKWHWRDIPEYGSFKEKYLK